MKIILFSLFFVFFVQCIVIKNSVINLDYRLDNKITIACAGCLKYNNSELINGSRNKSVFIFNFPNGKYNVSFNYIPQDTRICVSFFEHTPKLNRTLIVQYNPSLPLEILTLSPNHNLYVNISILVNDNKEVFLHKDLIITFEMEDSGDIDTYLLFLYFCFILFLCLCICTCAFFIWMKFNKKKRCEMRSSNKIELTDYQPVEQVEPQPQMAFVPPNFYIPVPQQGYPVQQFQPMFYPQFIQQQQSPVEDDNL